MDAIRIALYGPVKRDALLLLREILRHRSQSRFQFYAFTNPKQLLTCANAYDAAFLYVDSAAPDGLAVVQKLKSRKKAPILILVADDATLAPEAFPLAMRYLCKPIKRNLVQEAVDAMVQRLTSDKIGLKCGRESHWVYLRDILCLTTEKNYVYVHTAQRDYRVRGCLQGYLSKLPPDRFLPCSQGVVVNLDWVSHVEGDTVVLKDRRCYTISTGKRKSFARQYRMLCDRNAEYNGPDEYATLPPDDEPQSTKEIPEREVERIYEQALSRGNKLCGMEDQPRKSRILCAILALLASFGLFLGLSHEAGAKWIPDIRTATTTQKEYTTIEFIWPEYANPGNSTGRKLLNEPFDPLKGILPEGYRLQEGIALRENVKFATYINDSTGFIAYDISRASGTSTIDTENAEQFYETEINGHWAFFVQKNCYHLVWVDQKNATYHSLFANELELEEFMEIAQILSQRDEHE